MEGLCLIMMLMLLPVTIWQQQQFGLCWTTVVYFDPGVMYCVVVNLLDERE